MPKPSEAQIIEELKGLLTGTGTDYRSIMKLSSQLSKHDPNFQRFTVDARTLIHLGRDSIKDHTTALLELVKNSYDADSFNVDVEITSKSARIRIADNGFGMTQEQLVEFWLRIGFSNKRQSKNSELGRRKTGEKGIGRISTDRLGAGLQLISKTLADGIVGLSLNWNDFDQEGKDISDIDVKMTRPSSINIPDKQGKPAITGTEIIITELRQEWNRSNIESLFYELSALTPPYDDIEDFKISLKNDIAPEFSKSVDVDYYKAAEIEVTTIFDGSNEVYYEIKDKFSKTPIIEKIKLPQFYSKVDPNNKGIAALKCGPIEVRLMFFLRDSTAVMGAKFKLKDLKEFLDNNNGVKVYRDQIAVKPYGFPKAQLGYDWLGLGDRKAKNPAGAGRPDYVVSPYQVVGAVFIGRDTNLELLDSAAREGFVESEGFYDMKEFVLASLRLLENHRFSIYPEIEKGKNKPEDNSKLKEVDRLRNKLDGIRNSLNVLKDEIETEGPGSAVFNFLKPLDKTISSIQEIGDEVQETITDLLNWQRVMAGLATMGISSAVFGHETEDPLTKFQGALSSAIKELKRPIPVIIDAIESMDEAIQYSKQVAAWGAYALTRVQREKRRKKPVNILKTIKTVIEELQPAFEAMTIDLSAHGKKVYSNTYQMDIESVLVNLLTNAYTACQLTENPRQIVVELGLEEMDGLKGFHFTVSDTGPGIAPQYRKRVFDPLFSTKAVSSNSSKSIGTGLGLTIVKSIVDELEGKVSIDSDPILKGAKIKIWLKKE